MKKGGILPFGLLALLFLAAAQAAAQKQPATSRKPPAGESKQKGKSPAPSRKLATPAATPGKAKPRPPRKRRARAARNPGRQTQPTPARYREIQAALAAAGYFQGPANGLWGESSTAALSEFQRDHGLEPTGKIDSRSLIKLNLGPKYSGQTAPPSAAVRSP